MSHHAVSSSKDERGGFTLVELLVVIGIIALLVSILLPTLNRARAAAKRVQCASNLSQVGKALYIYADGHKGHLPPFPLSSSAPDSISCYLRDAARSFGMARDIFYCPSREDPINLFPQTSKQEQWDKPTTPGAHYGGDIQITYMNLVCQTAGLFDEFGTAITQPDLYSAVKLPTKNPEIALFADCMIFLPDRSWSPVPIYVSNHNKGTDSGGRFSPLKPIGGNVMFVDGHVEWRNLGDTKLRFRMEPAHMDIYY